MFIWLYFVQVPVVFSAVAVPKSLEQLCCSAVHMHLVEL